MYEGGGLRDMRGLQKDALKLDGHPVKVTVPGWTRFVAELDWDQSART